MFRFRQSASTAGQDCAMSIFLLETNVRTKHDRFGFGVYALNFKKLESLTAKHATRLPPTGRSVNNKLSVSDSTLDL
jgi:hypothetical protein